MALVTEKSVAFILIPGSFSPIPFWSKVVPYLISHGYETYPLPLLSCGKRTIAGPATMKEDAELIHKNTAEVLDSGKDAIVVMSSYGRIPGSEAWEGLSKEERNKEGKENGVVGLFYVGSFLAGEGMCLADLMGGNIPDFCRDAIDYIYMPADYDYRNIFAELPEDEATALLSRMPCQSKASFWDKLTYAAYLHFPVTYLLPVHDRTIPVEAQKMMIEMARSQGAKITLKTCDSGHAPMLSIPDQVAELLINAAVSLV